MVQKMELRVQNAELRTNEDGTMTVSGYVNKVGQFSNVLGVTKRFVEKIGKGVFTQAIKDAKTDIHFLAEHDSKKILASTRNNSLQLREDDQGLYMTATIADTTWGKDYFTLIETGLFKNMSFGFRSIKDSWKATASGIYERTIEEMELFEVSVVRDPAYSQSTIAARSIELIDEPEINVEEKKEERELPNEIKLFQLEISIERQKGTVRSAKGMVESTPGNPSFKSFLERENNRLSELTEEFRQLTKLQEETKMKTEERTLQGTAQGQSVQLQQVDNVVKKAESTSSVFSKARKIPFTGAELQIPYESSLDDADFIDEGANATELALNLSNFAKLKKRRVSKAISLSKQVTFDSGTDLSQYAKELVAKRIVKRIEKSILAGSAANEFKGIAPDTSVTSKNISLTVPVVSELRKVYLAVHEDFVGNSSWYMSRSFFEKAASVQDGDGEHVVKNIKVDGKVIPTLFGHTIEISSALANGDVVGQIPVLFGSIEDCYTVGVSKEVEVKQIQDGLNALRGSVAFVAEFLGDGRVHNYQAVAKGTIVA
jgi:HK97 family phage major capsid protein/HK97 family phage prohead protease